MLRAIAVLPKSGWSGEAADSVVLDFDDRHRRRIALKGVRGLDFLLDLPEAVALRGGDALRLEDGRLVEVVGAPEPLAEIRSADAPHLVRIAWHLGNRHLPTQFVGAKLRIRRDHVIEDMVRGLGAKVVEIEAPFDPEGGAYVSAAGHDHHAHGHAHDHGHSHDHGGGHRHAHEHHVHAAGASAAAHAHAEHRHDDAHGHDCGCGHDHHHHHHHKG
jgi:urease accessory protein